MPAVLRPALTSVTRRTLSSVLARDRSISFCRLRTRLEVPRLRCREDPLPQTPYVVLGGRQSIASQSRRSSSGPFTTATAPASPPPSVMASNLPFGSGVVVIVSAQAHLTRVSTLSGPGTARIRPVIRDGRRRGRPSCPGFLLPFGHRHSLLGSSCSRRGIGPSSRSAYRTLLARRTRTGFPRSTPARYDRGGCPLYPGDGGAPPGRCRIPGRRLPLPSGQSLHPASNIPSAGLTHNEASTGVHAIHPSGLPLACDPRMEREPLGFP